MLAGAAAGALAGCGTTSEELPAEAEAAAPGLPFSARTPGLAADPTATPSPTPSPTPTPTPTPFPAGHEEVALLAGQQWETVFSARHSGVDGPVVLFLGGVHGNEPGGWLAADELASYQPAAGSILVLPRANFFAINDFVRTHPELGDLNRLYPGNSESSLPMERLAAEIVETARRYRVDVLMDLHESWAFYATRTQDGTAFIGQTITAGVGPRNPAFVNALIERANERIGVERDLMVFRDGNRFRRPETAPVDPSGNRGRSSLSMNGHVPGSTPILVEMGQEDQPEARRVELHLIVAEEALGILGVV
jgi:hypothetical protein